MQLIRRSQQRCAVLLLTSLILIGHGCDDEGSDGKTIIIGGEAIGGETSGGGMGGEIMTGGMDTGGMMTGGMMTGGMDTGGMMTGGMMTGGMDTGGMITGGMMTGGMDTGGMLAGEMMGGRELGDPCEAQGIDLETPCSTTIYEVRDPVRISLNRVVSIEGVISAVRSGDTGVSHLVVQVSPQSPEYEGVAFSAVWVYLNDAMIDLPSVSVGESVTLTARLVNFYDQRQLQQVSAMINLGTRYPLLTPVEVSSASVASGGDLAEAYEGVLVRVSPVTVVGIDPPAGPGEQDPTGEFVVEGGLRVHDFITSLSPLPEVGESWDAIVGILRFGNGNMKLEPRSREDLGRPEPMGDPSGLRINEVDYSQPGADEGEFIEIMNTGSEPAPLWGVKLDLINGTNLASYASYELAEAIDFLEPGGLLVIGSVSVLMSLPPQVPSLGLGGAVQNGPDGIRLVHDQLGTLDTLGYGGLELEEGSALVVDMDVEGVSNSLSRCGVDQNNNAIDFTQQVSTPGAANNCL